MRRRLEETVLFQTEHAAVFDDNCSLGTQDLFPLLWKGKRESVPISLCISREVENIFLCPPLRRLRSCRVGNQTFRCERCWHMTVALPCLLMFSFINPPPPPFLCFLFHPTNQQSYIHGPFKTPCSLFHQTLSLFL